MENSIIQLHEKQIINIFSDIKNRAENIRELFISKPITSAVVKKHVYRQDGVSIDRIIETDAQTGEILKVTHYSYFDDKKISAIEEYEDGKKIRESSYNFFKVVTDFDRTSGKKIRTSNYDIKNKSKKISVYDYDTDTEKPVRITVYRPDGKSVSFIKEFSPQTGMVTRCINYKKDSGAISSVSQYKQAGETCIRTTYYYQVPLSLQSETEIEKQITADNINSRVLSNNVPKNVAKLIDNLYKKNKNKHLLNI